MSTPANVRSYATEASSEPFNALLVGGGFAMFGTPEGPWNISKRLEQKLGHRLSVQAVIEVDPPRAEKALAIKAEGEFKDSYANTVILKDVREFRARVDRGESKAPKAIFVATPPIFRGGLAPPKSLELDLMELFPDTAIFLEKPVATGTPWETSVNEAKEVGKLLEKHNAPVSTGYVLRYLKAVQRIKSIIEEKNLTVMATVARFVTAYELAVKVDWWNKDTLQGPIIEQATHIVDLCRFLGGEVDMDTIRAHALEAHEKPGQLSKKNFDESLIPDDKRIPRATTASWKYESGAVGIFLHATALHGVDYATQLEIYADGYSFILVNPFGAPSAQALHIRSPGSDTPEIFPSIGDDPYFTEIDGFIDTIENGPEPRILASYEDAAKTYEMTWVIRNSAEEMTQQVLAKKGKTA